MSEVAISIRETHPMKTVSDNDNKPRTRNIIIPVIFRRCKNQLNVNLPTSKAIKTVIVIKKMGGSISFPVCSKISAAARKEKIAEKTDKSNPVNTEDIIAIHFGLWDFD